MWPFGKNKQSTNANNSKEIALEESPEILQELKNNLSTFLDGKHGDTWKCKELLGKIDDKLVQKQFDRSTIKKLADEFVPMFLSIVALDEWKMDLHEAVIGTLSNIVPVATELNISWEQAKAEKILCKRLKEMNDHIDRNNNFTLGYKFYAWKAIAVLIYVKRLSKESIRELKRLKASMYEYDFVCESVERALSQTGST